MINTKEFYDTLIENNFDYFVGVPDSLLKDFCLCITDNTKDNHIITANEGNAVAIAAGYNIATSKYGVCYMQNSGLGNIINPLLSLIDEKVYNIPMLFIIGYRGEPGVKDEPQHIKQGELTLPLLDTLGIKYFILDENYKNQLIECHKYVKETNKPIALIVKKDTFTKYDKEFESNDLELTREEALETIMKIAPKKIVYVSCNPATLARDIGILEENYHLEKISAVDMFPYTSHTENIAVLERR